MQEDLLTKVFEPLGIVEPGKLGPSAEAKLRLSEAEAVFRERRAEIQSHLAKAAKSRAQTVQRLNIAFYVVIAIIIFSILGQFLLGSSNLILFVQAACTAVIYPISQRVDKNVTSQTYIEFVAAFLPDLQPQEAIKAIDQLYQVLSNPDSIKAVINSSANA